MGTSMYDFMVSLLLSLFITLTFDWLEQIPLHDLFVRGNHIMEFA